MGLRLICRKTKISVMYYVKNRKQHTLFELIKQHCQCGSVLFSDAASVYTGGYGRNSYLSQYGYYHYWINHTEQYVHDKFSFVTTGSIE
jgi:O-methyltransferase involved in polyketide biosynthesis